MTTENVKIGICNLNFNGVNLGLTQGGVNIEISISTTPSNEIGLPNAYDQRVDDMSVKVSCPLAEFAVTTLMSVYPWATASGAVKSIADIRGKSLRQYAKPLVLTATGDISFTIPMAIPVSNSNVKYSPNNERIVDVIFVALSKSATDLTLIQFS